MLNFVSCWSRFSRSQGNSARKARRWRAFAMCMPLLLLSALGAYADHVNINEKYPIQGPKGPALSPPHIEATNECSTHVYVDSFVPHATIKVYKGLTLIGGPVAPKTGFEAIPVSPALHTGDKITATQTVNGVTSAPSAPMIVGAMPTSLSPPTVDPSIYACGHVVPVGGLVSGVTVEVRDATAGATIGNGFTPNDWGSDWDPVGTSALVAGNKIEARQLACTGVKSGFSPQVPVQPEPMPLTAPVLDPPIVGNDAITMHGLFTGALVQGFDHAVSIGSGYATGESNWMSIAPPLSASSLVTAEQSLCNHSPLSPPQTPTTRIPPPQLLGPICPGQGAAFVRDTTINATLVLLKNGTIVGYGGAAPGDVPLDLAPPASFVQGDTIQVVEYIGSAVVFSNKVIVGCTRVSTYHNNAQRTGWNAAENTLTTANVKPGTFGHIVTVKLDDQVDTQPLVVTNQPIKGKGTRSVVYVTTENNTVYAIDSWTGEILLTPRNLGPAVPSPLGCSNNGPNVGINGTATIDLQERTLYVIAYTLSGGTPTHQLHALDLATLDDKAGSPVTVSATQSLKGGGSYSFNSTNQRQRPALLEANGNIYAGFGSYCDFNGPTTRGWVLGWKKGSLTPLPGNELTNRFSTAPTMADCTWAGNHPCFLSAIWMSGYGVAADPTGNLYFTTGNTASGSYDSTYNIAESAVKMAGNLSAPVDLFTPSDVNALDSGDNDYGSGGLMVLPDQPGKFPHLAVGAGKDGNLYVLNRDGMGGFHMPNIPHSVGIGACWCGPSYFNTASGGRVVSSGGDTVKLWSLTTAGSPAVPSLALVASGSPLAATGQDGGFFTSVSSNATTANTGIIWAVGRPTGTHNYVTLYAFNATPSGGTLPLLWSWPTAGNWPNTGGNANLVPTVANGRVYVASNKQLQIFGLISPSAHKRAKAEIPMEEAPAEVAPGPQFWGTVKSIDGDHMVLELRSGRLLQVDVSPAIQGGRAAIAQPGQPALVRGTLGSDGVFKADVVMRAKGPSLWGEDREK